MRIPVSRPLIHLGALSKVAQRHGDALTAVSKDMQTVTDTSREVARMIHAQLMAESGAERFRMGVEMFEAARRVVLASLPGGSSEVERKRLLVERRYGKALPFRPTR